MAMGSSDILAKFVEVVEAISILRVPSASLRHTGSVLATFQLFSRWVEEATMPLIHKKPAGAHKG